MYSALFVSFPSSPFAPLFNNPPPNLLFFLPAFYPLSLLPKPSRASRLPPRQKDPPPKIGRQEPLGDPPPFFSEKIG